MKNVFISHPSPYNTKQEQFLQAVEKKLSLHDLNPVNLGKNNWNYKTPLEPMKNYRYL